MLYNFHDTPEDLFERMSLNVDLNGEARRPHLVVSHAVPANGPP